MATRYVGSWLATILDLVVILDATALALAICVTIGRGFFALGRDGLLPRVFARTSRFDTPWVGNLMVLVGGAALILLATNAHYFNLFTSPGPGGKPVPVFPDDQFATFILAATVGSFAVELVYLMLAGAMTWRLAKRGGRWWQYVVMLIAIAAPVLGFYGALKPAPHNTTNYNYVALYYTLALIALAAIWFAVCRALFPDRVRNAASHATEHHGVAALDENLDFTPAS
jgi:amino acid transporter